MDQVKSNPHDNYFVIKENYEILQSIVDHLDAMVAYWDINQVCVFANNAYYDWFGKKRDQIIGHTQEELLGPLYPKNLPYILAAYEGQKTVFEREITVLDGTVRHSLATYTPHIVDGQVHGIFVHVANVTPLKILEHELRLAKERAEALATHDFLTGLPNRVLLQDRIIQALELAKRKNHMVAILSIDIDDFKMINDTYGHDKGDRILVEIASRTKSLLRESDTMTRMGGDEFLLLAVEIKSSAQAETLASRILKIGSQPFQLEDVVVLTTFSVGIALYPHDGTTPEALIANSDRALFVAKKHAKNCFAFAEQEEIH